jgi:PAB1-binding protein PBP1
MQSPNTKPIREDMQQRIEQFAGQVVTDLAAAMAGVMTNIGHKLGFYRAMAESGPLTCIATHPTNRLAELLPHNWQPLDATPKPNFTVYWL